MMARSRARSLSSTGHYAAGCVTVTLLGALSLILLRSLQRQRSAATSRPTTEAGTRFSQDARLFGRVVLISHPAKIACPRVGAKYSSNLGG